MGILYVLLFGLYSVYSFTQTDPNLTYWGNGLFLKFQSIMWQLGLDHRLLSAGIYTILITGLFLVYLQLISAVKQGTVSLQSVKKILLGSIFLLLVSNPALSHDLFNYLFNAKMVAVYHTDPHQMTALAFAGDPWTRFMRNTHTPAPYGYGWTALSIVPFSLGFGSFKLTLLSFKLFLGLFFALLVYSLSRLQVLLKVKNGAYKRTAFILNPLVLIETFGSGHNDVVMMGLALFALLLFYRYYQVKKPLTLLVSLIFLAFSVSIKLASIALLGGITLWFIAKKIIPKLGLAEANMLAMFTPLFTTRSQQFLPWYLIWPLSFLPLLTSQKIINILLIFSYFSLLRYIPQLYLPMFDRPVTDGNVRLIEIAISFVCPIVYLVFTAARAKKAGSLVE